MTLAELAHQVEHGRLHGHVEPRGRLVHDQERGFGDEGHGDDDALLLATRELVRVAPQHAFPVLQPDLGEHLERAGPGRPLVQALVEHGHFHELAPHRHDRVQARHRVLVHHGDASPSHRPQLTHRHRGDVAPLEDDPPAHDSPGPAQIAHDAEGDRRLAASGFADQAHGLAGSEREGQAGDDIDLAGPAEVRDAGILERENRGLSHGARSPGGRRRAG